MCLGDPVKILFFGKTEFPELHLAVVAGLVSGVFTAIAGDGAKAWIILILRCEKREFYIPAALQLNHNPITCLSDFDSHGLSEVVKKKC